MSVIMLIKSKKKKKNEKGEEKKISHMYCSCQTEINPPHQLLIISLLPIFGQVLQ